MFKWSSIVLLAIALVATNAVRKSSLDIKLEINGGGGDIEIHEFSYEDDSAMKIQNEMPAYSNVMDETDSNENNDLVLPFDTNDVDDAEVDRLRSFRFGSRKSGNYPSALHYTKEANAMHNNQRIFFYFLIRRSLGI